MSDQVYAAGWIIKNGKIVGTPPPKPAPPLTSEQVAKANAYLKRIMGK